MKCLRSQKRREFKLTTKFIIRMFINLHLFLFIEKSMERWFRLKHPDNELYIGISGKKPIFTSLWKSELFGDVESESKSGFITINLINKPPKVWNLQFRPSKLTFKTIKGNKKQRFTVIHIARDVVVIKSELGKCITYKNKKYVFYGESCKKNKKYKDQIFLITDESGIWKGTGSHETGWGSTGEKKITWGICSDCVENGFGSEKQGVDFDNAKKDSFSKKGTFSTMSFVKMSNYQSESNKFYKSIIEDPFNEQKLPYKKSSFSIGPFSSPLGLAKSFQQL